MRLAAGMLAVVVASSPSAAKASDESLIQKEMVLNDACRGGSGDEEATQNSCAERDAVFSMLRSRGWCYGTEEQAGYQKSWQKCPSAPVVNADMPPSSGRVEFDPRAMIQNRLVDEAFDRAETCVCNWLRIGLYQGQRDRKALVTGAAKQCENDLMAFLSRTDAKSADRNLIHAALIASGYRQLDSVISRGE
jgi:hypothetical protein